MTSKKFFLFIFLLTTFNKAIPSAIKKTHYITAVANQYYFNRLYLYKNHHEQQNYNFFIGNFFSPVKNMPNDFQAQFPHYLDFITVSICTTETKISDIHYYLEQEQGFCLFETKLYSNTISAIDIAIIGSVAVIGNNHSFIKIKTSF